MFLLLSLFLGTSFLFPPAAFGEPLPELTQMVEDRMSAWTTAMESSSSSHQADSVSAGPSDLQQFYVQVNPYLAIGAGIAQIQIVPQFGFLWVREAPESFGPIQLLNY